MDSRPLKRKMSEIWEVFEHPRELDAFPFCLFIPGPIEIESDTKIGCRAQTAQDVNNACVDVPSALTPL